MTVINISLPEDLKDFVDMQTDACFYSSSNEYILSLICEDYNKHLSARLSMLLQEGMNSGQSISADTAYWNNKLMLLT